jgi:hypothetical protein
MHQIMLLSVSDLPKESWNIMIDIRCVKRSFTYVNIDKLSFAIDKDVFSKTNIRNIWKNALVDAQLKGTINLGNLSQAYPIKIRQTTFSEF